MKRRGRCQERLFCEKLNKMSIEYQLYWMSLTNRVIIPKVGSRQNMEEQNVFKHSSFTLTPQKDHQKAESIYWKKSMSAFKKFKQKKDKKDKRDDLVLDQPDNQDNQHPKPLMKLFKKTTKSRSCMLLDCGQEFISLLEEPNVGYFDPNEAPLYMASGEEAMVVVPAKQKKMFFKAEVTVSNLPEVKLQSQESEAMEEDIPLLTALEPLPGDPFIIIRKNSSRKSLKSAKTKFIKKQKIQKLRFRDSINENESLFKDRSKFSISNEIRAEDRESDKESSSEKMARGTKQIYTLQQIVQSAHDKQNQQNKKMSKFKDSCPDPGIMESITPEKKEGD